MTYLHATEVTYLSPTGPKKIRKHKDEYLLVDLENRIIQHQCADQSCKYIKSNSIEMKTTIWIPPKQYD